MREAHRLVALGRDVVVRLRGHDLALISAGVTYYAAISLVPGVLVAISLLGLLLGEPRTAELGRSLADALPDDLGAPAVVNATFQAATTTSPLVVAAAAAPVLLLPVLLVTPTLARLFADSGVSAALGVVVAFTVDWLVLTATLALVYRVVGPGRPAWAATLWAATVTGSFVAGFVQGFVLFLSFSLDLGLPFGGFSAVGGAVAVGFWLFLLHLLVLVGYSLALRLDERAGVPLAEANTRLR